MVKPQFEVGKERLGKGGVVREPALRADAVAPCPRGGGDRGWGARALSPSPLPGPSGNVEFFVWLRRGAGEVDRDAIAAEVARSASWGVPGEKVSHVNAAPLTPRSPSRPMTDARSAASCWSPTRAARTRATWPGLWSARSPSTGSSCACSTTRPRSSTSVPTTASSRSRSTERRCEQCELAVVLGGDGTILRAAELTRGTRRPLLGRQPRPRRVPRRGRERGRRRR